MFPSFPKAALLAATLLIAACCTQPRPDGSPDSTPAPLASVGRATLSPGQLARIEAVQETLAEFDSTPLEEWITNFQLERSPEKEIVIYEAVAFTYRDYCAHHALTPGARREVYQLLLMRSAMPDEEVMLKARPALLSSDEVQQVLRSYPSTIPPSPAHT